MTGLAEYTLNMNTLSRQPLYTTTFNTCLITDVIQSMEKLKIFDKFKKYAGLDINIEKLNVWLFYNYPEFKNALEYSSIF